jgi:hypothetical protein
MTTKPHTVLKLDSERSELNVLCTPMVVVCEDGSVYTYTIGSHSDAWYPLPPVPGTKAAEEVSVSR